MVARLVRTATGQVATEAMLARLVRLASVVLQAVQTPSQLQVEEARPVSRTRRLGRRGARVAPAVAAADLNREAFPAAVQAAGQ